MTTEHTGLPDSDTDPLSVSGDKYVYFTGDAGIDSSRLYDPGVGTSSPASSCCRASPINCTLAKCIFAHYLVLSFDCMRLIPYHNWSCTPPLGQARLSAN